MSHTYKIKNWTELSEFIEMHNIRPVGDTVGGSGSSIVDIVYQIDNQFDKVTPREDGSRIIQLHLMSVAKNGNTMTQAMKRFDAIVTI